MQFGIQQSIEILERTAAVLNTLLTGINDEWVMNK